jgi:hypothetical protein
MRHYRTFLEGVIVMPHLRTMLLVTLFILLLANRTSAEEKSFYSPVIYIDKEAHRVLISTLGSVFWIEVPPSAQPHMETLPISGLVDFVVEMRGKDQAPLLKSWKVKSGESTCMQFDGKACK